MNLGQKEKKKEKTPNTSFPIKCRIKPAEVCACAKSHFAPAEAVSHQR